MPERSGLRNILDEARATLGHLLLHINVREVGSIEADKPLRLGYSIDCNPHTIDCSLSATGNSQEFHIASTTNQVTAFTEVIDKKIETDFQIDTAVRDIKDTCTVEVSSVECTKMTGDIEQLEIIEPSLSSEACDEFRLATPKSQSVTSIPVKDGHVEEVDPSFHRAPKRGLDTIYNIPMKLSPTPWASLDRSFIVRCWDTLKNGASGNLGEETERELEMAAVFNRVDMTHVRRTKYDPMKRVLKLWPGDSLMRDKPGLRRCAIIIGLVKGTGKVIQVAMPLDNRS